MPYDATTARPRVWDFGGVVRQAIVIGVLIVIGLSREVQNESFGRAKILQPMPNAGRYHDQEWARITRVKLIQHASGLAVVASVIKNDLNVPLVDE
jgi:hypothetical protein